MDPPAPILDRYAPALAGLRWHRAAGGFSGADVWRGDDDTGTPLVALKAWPPDYPAARLARVHAWVARAAHLPFMPAVLPTAAGPTFAAHGGRLWDVARWVPGAPRETPTESEVEAACTAVARLHAVWPATGRAPCPGVRNRLRILRDWLTAPLDPDTFPEFAPGLNSLLRRAAALVSRAAPAAVRELEHWEHVAVTLRPCVRDLRGDHVLFSGGEVTGVVDYGAMAEDHPAVDLARLLGDFAGESDVPFAAGLRAYRAAGGELDTPDGFVGALARAGALGSVVTWLVRLGRDGRAHPDTDAVEARLGRLVGRLGRFGPT